MLLRCLLVALPVLVYSQRYFLSFVFNNNRNVRNVNSSMAPRSQQQESPVDESDTNPIMGVVPDTAAENDDEDQKNYNRRPLVQSMESSRRVSKRSTERIEHLDRPTLRNHAHSYYQKHSTSYEKVRQDDLEGWLNNKDSVSPRNHLIEFVSESQENTDEKSYSNADNNGEIVKERNIKNEIGNANTKGKGKGNNRSGNTEGNSNEDGKVKGNDNAKVISNGNRVDNSNDNTKGSSNGNLKDNSTNKGNDNGNGTDFGDSKDNKNTELSHLRVGNIDCVERSGLDRIFALSLPEMANLNVKFLCNISGYQNPWLLVLRETFPNPKYQADFSGGFTTPNYENFAISMDTLSHITSHAVIQMMLIARWDKTKCVYSKYNRFTVGDAFKSYELMRLGLFEGNTSDWMTHFIGEPFVDYQVEHLKKFQCEIMQLGGWWALNTTHCVFPEDKKPNTAGSVAMFIQRAPSG